MSTLSLRTAASDFPPLAMRCFLLSTLPLFLACGGQTRFADFPPPSPDAVSYDDKLGARADVSGGRARIGGFWLGNEIAEWEEEDAAPPTSLDLAPLPCSGTDAASAAFPFGFNAEVIVAPFRLMTTEVTNDAYAVCVDSGACAQPDIPRADSMDWRSPDVAQQPVLVTWSLANAFCHHYGGDLPTAGEYARATVGDGETYAQPAVLSLVLECALGPPSNLVAECTRLRGNGPLANVGSDPSDVGPFGHVDLYGNAWEWVRGYFDENSAPFCSSPLYEHDIPLTYPDASAQDAATFPPNAIMYSPEI